MTHKLLEIAKNSVLSTIVPKKTENISVINAQIQGRLYLLSFKRMFEDRNMLSLAIEFKIIESKNMIPFEPFKNVTTVETGKIIMSAEAIVGNRSATKEAYPEA